MKKHLLFLFLILFIFHYGYSNESKEKITVQNIYISSRGITQESAVRLAMDLKEGDSFSSWDEFFQAYNKQEMTLANTRLFKDISLSYSSEKTETGDELVDVFILLNESFNFIILPYADYDSNNGLTASIRLRDYNFLGGMGPLALNINYKYYTDSADGEHEFSLNSTYTRDFSLFNHYFQFNGGQDFFIFTEDPKSYGDLYYLKTNLELTTRFNTKLIFPDTTPVYYYLKLKGDAQYNFSVDDPISDERKRLGIAFNHGISFENIQWTENFRDGYSFKINNVFDFNLLSPEKNDIFFTHINLYTTFFKSFSPFQFSARLVSLNYINETTNMDSYLRGVKEDYIIGSHGIYLNTNFSIWGFQIPRFIDFHAGIFMDFGLNLHHGSSTVNSDIFSYTAGIEVIAYALFSKSLYLRASLGYDMKKLWERRTYNGDHYELYIGLGHFF